MVPGGQNFMGQDKIGVGALGSATTTGAKTDGDRDASGVAKTNADRATNAKNNATDVVVGHVEKSGIEAVAVCSKLEATVALTATGDRHMVGAPKTTAALVNLVEKPIGDVQKQNYRAGQQETTGTYQHNNMQEEF